MKQQRHMLKNKLKMNKAATIWEVFIQSKNGLPHKHVGNVHAEDKEMALQNARDLYTRRNEGSCIWVVKSEHIVSSVPEDEESFLILQMIRYIDTLHSMISLMVQKNIFKCKT